MCEREDVVSPGRDLFDVSQPIDADWRGLHLCFKPVPDLSPLFFPWLVAQETAQPIASLTIISQLRCFAS